jgi:hypothetical protein
MVPLKLSRVWVELIVNRRQAGDGSPLGLGDGVLAQGKAREADSVLLF